MDILEELNEISRLIQSADFINSVRDSVAKVRREGAIVTDGRHHPDGDGFDAVVRCGSDSEDFIKRLQNDLPDVRVAMIAENVLGVKNSRRSRDG
jgi:hypothetical protein